MIGGGVAVRVPIFIELDGAGVDEVVGVWVENDVVAGGAVVTNKNSFESRILKFFTIFGKNVNVARAAPDAKIGEVD